MLQINRTEEAINKLNKPCNKNGDSNWVKDNTANHKFKPVSVYQQH